MKAKVGDKVRLKLDRLPRARGIIERAEGKKLVVRLEESERKLQVAAQHVTNLSGVPGKLG
jgi:ribosome maturation factor RimP